MRKDKRLRGELSPAWDLLHNDGNHSSLLPGEARSLRLDDARPVSREVRAGFCERRGARLPRRLNHLARRPVHE
jgi:hypothetical protein